MPKSTLPKQMRTLLILDGISDPGNLGTLLRTALALGWEGAFLTEGSTDPYNDKAQRAAKGATFKLPWKQGSLEELHAALQCYSLTLYGADASGKDIRTITPVIPCALALGNEAHGLSAALKKGAQSVAVAMSGPMESLNVASAGAILMHSLGGT